MHPGMASLPTRGLRPWCRMWVGYRAASAAQGGLGAVNRRLWKVITLSRRAVAVVTVRSTKSVFWRLYPGRVE